MPNISPTEKCAKLAAITAAIMSHTPYSELCRQINADSNNLRAFMVRNGLEVPDFWKPRRCQRRKAQLIEENSSADASTLTDEQRETADSLRISYSRMAFLLACPNSGNARGWMGGSAIG